MTAAVKHIQSPFSTQIPEKEAFIRGSLDEMGVKLPGENPHFLAHLNEFSLEAIEEAFRLWKSGSIIGAHQFTLPWNDQMATRLVGQKMGEGDLSEEPRSLKDRGQGRGFQPCVVRGEPYTETNKVSVICFPMNGKPTLFTLYSGPLMAPFENDPEQEWSKSALAFRADEL
tara:strand:- start:2202 stop:2714 length:513 start_codon:yes stop_codon:yes gene_type:complete